MTDSIRFGPLRQIADLGLAEGVETGLSAMQIARVPVWCCLGAGRMHRIAIPSVVRETFEQQVESDKPPTVIGHYFARDDCLDRHFKTEKFEEGPSFC